MYKVFNPNRLNYARVKCGLSMKQLSDILSITTRTLSKYENGHDIPKNSLIDSMAEILFVPKVFFFKDDLPDIEFDSVSFRSSARKTATQRDKALCSARLAIEVADWLSKKFTMPKIDIPDYKHLSPAAAASALRKEWGIGEKSISNMVHLLESKGVFVFSIYEDNKEIDAFCFKKGSQPFIFLNKFKSAERSRFDAAHELGHLVLHQHGEPIGKNREREADEFSSAFLMPESSIRSQALFNPTVEKIVELKSYWKVSVAALLRRWYDLGLTSEWVYRRLNIELSKRGFLKQEPCSISHEQSQIIDKILKHLWSIKFTQDDLAEVFGVYTGDIERLMFGGYSPKKINNTALTAIKN